MSVVAAFLTGFVAAMGATWARWDMNQLQHSLKKA